MLLMITMMMMMMMMVMTTLLLLMLMMMALMMMMMMSFQLGVRSSLRRLVWAAALSPAAWSASRHPSPAM